MAKMKDLRDQSEEHLHALLEDIDKEIFELRAQLAMTRKLERPHLIREKKRDKAKILTLLTERCNAKG